jgi:hypothetical protein
MRRVGENLSPPSGIEQVAQGGPGEMAVAAAKTQVQALEVVGCSLGILELSGA